MLQGLGVARAMGHLEHLGLVVLVVLGEEQDVSVERIDCHSFTVVCMVGIFHVDVLNFVGADHNIMPVPVVRYFWLLELVNCKRGPGEDKCVIDERWWYAAMLPVIGVVTNISQINVADAVLLVDSDVLPVTARRSLQLNIGKPST